MEKTQRNEFGLPNIVIPAEALFHPELSSTEKILFGIISNLSATESGCWACNRYLANLLSLKSQTISNAISTLKNLGFLEVTITQRSDGMQVRRMFIDKDYLKKHEKMLIGVYKKINRDIILKKSITPIKKIKEGYKKNLNNIDIEIDKEIDKISSKEDYVFSKHEEFILEIINFWNNLPNTTIHSKTDTKIYKTISLQIKNLLCGNPLIRKKDFLPTKPFSDFLTKNNIPSKLHTKTWKIDEVKDIFQIIHNEYPAEGSKLSLDNVFWNAFAKRRGGGFSLFLHTAAQTNTPQEYIQLADKFATTIGSNNASHKKQDAQEFQNFIEDENIPIGEVNSMIDWYRINQGGQYIPVIDNAKEFRQKYSKLIRAKNNKIPRNKIPEVPPAELSPAGFPLITHSYDRKSKKKKTIEEWQLLLEGYSNQLLGSNIWKQNYTPDKITVFNGIVSMQKWLDNIDYDCISPAAGGSLEYRIYPLNKLIDYYILCIDDWWSWMDKVKDSAIHVNSKTFKMFIHELEISFAVKIDIKSKGWINDSNWTPRN